jgi:predicted nucleotidyltransferase component of viral defense system
MNMEKIYIDQVRLLLRVLPEFQSHKSFALKGGTAINLFIRNLPRLSVDLDFSYIPIADRKTSLEEINLVAQTVAKELERKIPNSHLGLRKTAEGYIYQILIQQNLAAVKVDINHIIRGTVFPCQQLELCAQAQQEFGVFCEANVLSFDDLYAGKICAALDRQHPRDFFDIKHMLDGEGLTENLVEAFVVYLISHNRPMHELLNPHLHSFEEVFENEFHGMAFQEISYAELIESAKKLVTELHKKLTAKHREFLISFKRLEPKWELLRESHIAQLPAVKWKILNLKRLPNEKRQQQLALLEGVLYP